jgi:hypothetical protein
MKSVVSFFLASLIIFSGSQNFLLAQKVVTKISSKNTNPVPADPLSVAIDAPPPPPPPPPPFAFSVGELKFGAQGTGIESCIKVTITNMTNSSQTITRLFCDDEKNYSIPSPTQKMLPISIQPRTTFDISICFVPEKVGVYKTRLVIGTPEDSSVLPVSGKGMKPEDISKLPKTDLTVIKPKKKGKDWIFKLQLISSSKITMQLFDDLGVMALNILNNDLKNEGVYEIPFDGLGKDKKKLPAGNYYLRCVIDDIIRAGTPPTKLTKVITLED